MLRQSVRSPGFASLAVMALVLVGCGGSSGQRGGSGGDEQTATGGVSGSGGAAAGSGGMPAASGGTLGSGGAGSGGARVASGGVPGSGGSGGTSATGGHAAGGGIGGPGSGGAPGTGGRGGSPSVDGGTPDGSDAAGGGGGGPPPAGNPPPPLTGTPVTATIKVTRGAPMGRLTAGAASFSFEKSHLSDGFFTGTHAPLIGMFKLLGPGVLRIGADDVNNSVWVPGATFVKPGTTSPNVGTAEVDALADFLTATGWKAIYAVNMRGSSTPQTAVTELTYVVPKLGASLQAVEIGNELNLYPISNAETVWRSFAQAIRQQFPGTLIAGPGDFEDVNYATSFVKNEASLIDVITHHYYRGQAGTSTATLANLVNTDSAVTSGSQALASSASSNAIKGGFRFGETNTYSSHGQAGISNALISALWAVNFIMTTSQYGSVGVNFHGGGQNMDGNTCPNGVSSCDRPFVYSPLVEVDSRVTAAAPLFYGMLLVSRAGAGQMMPAVVSNAGTTPVRAYAVQEGDGGTAVVVVNCDASKGVDATVDVGAPVTDASAIYLRGSSLTATSGITLGEAPVNADGSWSPKPAYTLSHGATTLTVPVPAASAVLITAR